MLAPRTTSLPGQRDLLGRILGADRRRRRGRHFAGERRLFINPQVYFLAVSQVACRQCEYGYLHLPGSRPDRHEAGDAPLRRGYRWVPTLHHRPRHAPNRRHADIVSWLVGIGRRRHRLSPPTRPSMPTPSRAPPRRPASPLGDLTRFEMLRTNACNTFRRRRARAQAHDGSNASRAVSGDAGGGWKAAEEGSPVRPQWVRDAARNSLPMTLPSSSPRRARTR